MYYATQTEFSAPRALGRLFSPLPADPSGIGEVIRNIVVHYRASGIDFPPDRLAEVDSRWVDRLLEADRRRFNTPLTEPRAPEQRIVGCCRDFTLLTVAALRHKGIQARSRIGFADYLAPDWHYDHVITEYWDGAGWVGMDSQVDKLVPLAPGGFRTAAQVWTAYRRGEIDVDQFGVDPSVDELRGAWFVRNYVIAELAHLRGRELLLWDLWGGMSRELTGDLALIDEVADLLLSLDAGDTKAETRLGDLWLNRAKELQPQGHIRCASPVAPEFTVDLESRSVVTPAAT